MSDLFDNHWYVLYTKSRNEKAVAQRLTGVGFDTFCPLKKVRRRWSDRWKWVEEPLFTSYCFVYLSESEREKVFRVPGVVRYLFWLGKPATVRNEEIERIKAWLSDFDHNAIEVHSFAPGERVRIGSGPLVDQKGEVVDSRGNQLHLRIDGLGLILSVDTRKNKVELHTT